MLAILIVEVLAILVVPWLLVWWQTASGGVKGDGPANVVEEFDEGWTGPSPIPGAVRTEIAACYREGLGRELTHQGLDELLAFCREATARYHFVSQFPASMHDFPVSV